MKKVTGFTLIELIVVIAILGCMATILASMISKADSYKSNECPVTIGDAEYITSPEHCEALRLYIESTIVR